MNKSALSIDQEFRLPQCLVCIHRKDGDRCDAFPQGIPRPILHDEFDHRQAYLGDGGIQFQAKDGFFHPRDPAGWNE